MLELTLSGNNMYCIELTATSVELKNFLRSELLNNMMNSEAYQQRSGVSPFLQGDSGEWILIEFWSNDYDKIVNYINYLNNKIAERNLI